jgi:hypothetical protein
MLLEKCPAIAWQTSVTCTEMNVCTSYLIIVHISFNFEIAMIAM